VYPFGRPFDRLLVFAWGWCDIAPFSSSFAVPRSGGHGIDPVMKKVAATGLFLMVAACAGAAAGASDVPSPAPAHEGQGAPAGHGAHAGTATADAAGAAYTDADVAFMHGMIAHHAQAVVMTSLVEERTTRADLRLLARRIDMSQREEMEIMRRWLEERGVEVPAEGHGHHHHHGHGAHGGDHELMPGMLSEEQLARLTAARGPEFDRLFLEYMIFHHEGALVMVAELFEAGGGQDSELFQFASHVDSDQRIEIARMSRMLTAGR
jgi:uncharacterized protein (DUF305 family)